MKLHAKSPKRACVALLVVALAICALLSSCSSSSSNEQHKIMVNPCEDCADVETYEVEVPAGCVTSGGTVILRSDEPVYLCEPAFTSKNGSTFIPYAKSRFIMKQDEVTVTLEPGVYAFCLDRGQSSICKVVVVREDSSNVPEIDFK